ncbi:hypothetical protein [Pedobacter sp. UYP1]|uniref:hypothetical protein n=1 Tax=Pedobacter sp. UYP1 TaxID=1756396 RepID=UPI003396B25D
MVKIQIEDQEKFEDSYLKELKDELFNMLNWLQTAISHLEGSAINMHSLDQKRVKNYTRHLTKVIDGEQFLIKKDYDAADYVTTVANFRLRSVKLAAVNFTKLRKLLVSLLAQNGIWLNSLLICAPQDLIRAERYLAWKFQINDPFNKRVLELIFYKKSNPFWDIVKNFYRNHLPLIACPYCNMVVIKPIASTTKYAKTASLDHFFDESRHPILAFCLYNLVPSDTDCNSTNKNSTEFKHDYHLNPYEEGFGKHVRFKAIIDPPNTVRDIDLVLSLDISLEKIKRVLGDVPSYDDTHKHGNINVFQLKTLYSDKYYKDRADEAIEDIKNMNGAMSSVRKMIQLLPFDLKRSQKAYVRWYEKKLKTPFFEKNFQNQILSKLTRDLHDEFYAKTNHPINFYINNLIDSDEVEEL